jgi:dTDP-4-amino-4,6-dideoxygalactose transaminase
MAPTNSIPLVDLKAAHAEIADEVAEGFQRVLATTGFIGGPEVAAFEEEYARFSGVQHVVGVANGTDALELALRAVGVGSDDEVVLPANTFIAPAEAVARTGARPVLVDCEPGSHLIDVQAALAAVGPQTAAVIPVHLYGQHAEVEQLTTKLSGSGVHVVEDAAQCQGATRLGRTAGADGGIAATSFYPGKNLGAYGDGGAVLTDDADLAATVRALANHGGLSKYSHDLIGFNSRLDALQAVVLRAKLRRLAEWNEARRAAADRYAEMLTGVAGIKLPATHPGNEHVWHLYVIQLDAFATDQQHSDREQRDALVAKLNADGIGAGVHYPTALHLTPAFTYLGYEPGAFPNAEAAASRILSLPLHPHITAQQQERVVEVLKASLQTLQ